MLKIVKIQKLSRGHSSTRTPPGKLTALPKLYDGEVWGCSIVAPCKNVTPLLASSLYFLHALRSLYPFLGLVIFASRPTPHKTLFRSNVILTKSPAANGSLQVRNDKAKKLIAIVYQLGVGYCSAHGMTLDKYECAMDQEPQRTQRANNVTRVRRARGSRRTSWPPSWKCDVISKIRLRQSMDIYFTNKSARFHPDPIWNGGAL